ncbi:hypothetical protein [Halalkalibacter lacteus]|uniref:hypothetical protein n=1 Tax=Halalkalibacter lacteus TaxID=3090663 RepID=UPI002FC6B9F7
MRISMHLLLLAVVLYAGGCQNNENTINKAIVQVNYPILIPNYIPVEFELVKSELENEFFYLKYQNEEGSMRVELTQDSYSNLNWDKLLEFVETEENPYDLSPFFSYEIIGQFVGEYSVTPSVNALHFTFIPITRRGEADSFPYYNISAVGLNEEEFQQIVQSLKKYN